MKYRPGWLTAYTVIAIVLGALGCLMALIGVFGLLMADQFQEMAFQMQQPGATAAMDDAITEMNSKMAEVTDRWLGVNIAVTTLQFLVSIALVVSGILALSLRPDGRKVLVSVFVAAAVLDSVQLIPQVMMQREIMPIQQESMQKMMQGAPGAIPGMASNMQSTMATITFLYMGIWLIIKLSYYISGFVYLRRPAILSLYGEQPDGIDDESVETVDPV